MAFPDWLHQHQDTLRLTVFAGSLLLMLLWESISPRRKPTYSRITHGLNNLILIIVGNLSMRLLLPVSAVAVAGLVANEGWGLLPYLGIEGGLAMLAGFVLLDLAIYFQHVMFHAVPVLWRLHRVHHADPDYDTTTGFRFHPIEILLSTVIKLAVIAVLGAPVAAVILFEVVLSAAAMFNHGNIRLPIQLDRVLRWAIVTPDMHRVHHSVHWQESNSNFGFNIPWWDRLFGTYWAQPIDGHEHMRIGLNDFPGKRPLWLHWMLWIPFMHADKQYSLARGRDKTNS